MMYTYSVAAMFRLSVDEYHDVVARVARLQFLLFL
jgi:hypothetical protein